MIECVVKSTDDFMFMYDVYIVDQMPVNEASHTMVYEEMKKWCLENLDTGSYNIVTHTKANRYSARVIFYYDVIAETTFKLRWL